MIAIICCLVGFVLVHSINCQENGFLDIDSQFDKLSEDIHQHIPLINSRVRSSNLFKPDELIVNIGKTLDYTLGDRNQGRLPPKTSNLERLGRPRKRKNQLTKKFQDKSNLELKMKNKTEIRMNNEPKLISVNAKSDSTWPRKSLVIYDNSFVKNKLAKPKPIIYMNNNGMPSTGGLPPSWAAIHERNKKRASAKNQAQTETRRTFLSDTELVGANQGYMNKEMEPVTQNSKLEHMLDDMDSRLENSFIKLGDNLGSVSNETNFKYEQSSKINGNYVRGYDTQKKAVESVKPGLLGVSVQDREGVKVSVVNGFNRRIDNSFSNLGNLESVSNQTNIKYEERDRQIYPSSYPYAEAMI